MRNNFEIIKKLLDFSDKDTYYFLQILKRRKDNPDMDRDMIVIDDIFIYTLEQYDNMQEDIIKTCTAHNARAYFRVNKRSLKKSGMQMLKRVTDLIISENYKAIKNAYSSVSGEFHADEDKKWIIDIDNISIDAFNHDPKQIKMREELIRLQKETGREPHMTYVPSKNGVHILTRPFNLKLFKDEYPNIDIHKDNPIILYCP